VSLRDETSKVALEPRVLLGPIHDHPLPRLVLGLLQRERRPDHVAGQLLASLGIAGLDTHLVVHREAAVLPAQQLGHQVLVYGLIGEQHLENGPAQLLLKQLGGDGRQDPERPVGVEDAVGDQGVDVGMECDQVPEGLHEQDEAGLAVRIGLPVGFAEQAPDDAAELAQAVTLVRSGTGKCRSRT
jgi:hypothetical protein